MPKFKTILTTYGGLCNSWHLNAPRSGLRLYSHFHLRERLLVRRRTFGLSSSPSLIFFIFVRSGVRRLSVLLQTTVPPSESRHSSVSSASLAPSSAFLGVVVSSDFFVSSYTRGGKTPTDRPIATSSWSRVILLSPAGVLSQILVVGY